MRYIIAGILILSGAVFSFCWSRYVSLSDNIGNLEWAFIFICLWLLIFVAVQELLDTEAD